MSITDQNVRDLLKPIVKEDQLENIAVCGADVRVDILFSSTADPTKEDVLAKSREALKSLDGVGNINVGVSTKTPFAKPAAPAGAGPTPPAGVVPPNPKQVIPGIKHIIAISSGKGGVGKTTVSVNLACALEKQGKKVGILDADVYGPNVPIMMGLRQAKLGQSDQNKLVPPENHGVKVVSIGFLVKEEQPVVWRGPMLDKIIRQFLTDVEWGELDYLLIDLPPGTGDAQLTIMQAATLSGAIIVTTPQEVAIHDSKKGLAMFKSQNIPLLGVIENMSYFRGDDGKEYEIFGRGGGRKAAELLEVPFLGEVPIVSQQRAKADEGFPVVTYDADSEQAKRYMDIADKMANTIAANVPELASV